LKALSIRQPWAWLIANGHKHIENRTWRTSYRGPILIHASQGMTRQEYEDAFQFVMDVGGIELARRLPRIKELERGGVVGFAELRACIEPSMRTSPWHIDGCYGFALFNCRPLSFVPCKGALGIFGIPVTL
jgi:hypothetical protein